MSLRIDESLCLGCSLCLIACADEAIKMDGTATINEEKCQECFDCMDHCPAEAVEEVA
jgi:Fe-S-cluster-containing hydrogenase component 2